MELTGANPELNDSSRREQGRDPRRRAARAQRRHLYGSLQLAAGETLVDVAELMGHADSAITAKVYAHQVARGARAERRRARGNAADANVTPLETAGGERGQTEGSAEVAIVAEIGSASGLRRAVANKSG